MTRAWFNDTVNQLSRKLYCYAFRILQNQEEAEDTVQEIFIKLWKMGDKLNNYDSIDALAITMTKNHCIDQIRKKKIVINKDEIHQNYKDFILDSPHEFMIRRESNEILHHIIENLPGTYRDIIVLREIEGFSYEEIADKTDQNINTLRVNLSRARKMIRDEYNKHHYERRRFK